MAKAQRFKIYIISLTLLSTTVLFLYKTSTLRPDYRNKQQAYYIARKSLDNGKFKRHETDDYSKQSFFITMDDLHITVRTTKKSHKSRLQIILDTWFKKARNKVYVITDEDDEEFRRKTNNHLVATSCKSHHAIPGLCCKVGSEFDTFIIRTEKWWCHFDDDVYVNVKALLRFLSQFDWNEPFYIGRSDQRNVRHTKDASHASYWFLKGGSLCFSRALAEKMEPICGNGGLLKTCLKAKMVDDTTLGYIIYSLLNVSITNTMLFHSHYENMATSNQFEELEKQITFSYKGNNVTPFKGKYLPAFSLADDPTRFLSIHCLLYPNDVKICRPNEIKMTKS